MLYESQVSVTYLNKIIGMVTCYALIYRSCLYFLGVFDINLFLLAIAQSNWQTCHLL